MSDLEQRRTKRRKALEDIRAEAARLWKQGSWSIQASDDTHRPERVLGWVRGLKIEIVPVPSAMYVSAWLSDTLLLWSVYCETVADALNAAWGCYQIEVAKIKPPLCAEDKP